MVVLPLLPCHTRCDDDDNDDDDDDNDDDCYDDVDDDNEELRTLKMKMMRTLMMRVVMFTTSMMKLMTESTYSLCPWCVIEYHNGLFSYMGNNQITSLPSTVFSGLTALTELFVPRISNVGCVLMPE